MGIETYERALQGARAQRGEREYLGTVIGTAEELINRHNAYQLSQGAQTLADHAARAFISDQRLIVMGPTGGLFKPKFQHWSFGYADLKTTVARTAFSLGPGSKPDFFVAGWSLKAGDDPFVATFFEEDERDAFANDLQARLVKRSESRRSLMV